MKKRLYYIFSNGRLVRHQNTVYLHTYEGPAQENEVSLADAAAQAGCVLEDLADEWEENAQPTEIDLESCLDADEAPQNETEQSREEEQSTLGGNDGFDDKRAVVSKRPIPIEDVEAFYLFGETDLNTKLLNFLARHRVPLHVFNYYGFYSGTFYGRQEVSSGYLLVHQVRHYDDAAKRLDIARRLVDGASFNILKTLKYYGAASRGRDMSPFVTAIEAERAKIASAPDVNSVMGLEGTIRATYYQAWPLIFSAPWAEFEKRVRRPPDNPINALISFSNSLCYTLALSEIYRTPLSPLISFLHEPGARRFSLSLDIAEIFKPILCDRILFKLVNNGELRPQHFDDKLNFCYLKEEGRKIFLREWDERLKQTIEHRNLGRKVSYRRLMRLECYKLQKHLLGIETYQPFKLWW
jgi:CRISPR-associated protein Cas1